MLFLDETFHYIEKMSIIFIEVQILTPFNMLDKDELFKE